MSSYIISLFLICITFYDISYGLSILHGTIKCRSLCEKTFSPHTYPESEHYLACQRGCFRSLKIDAWLSLGIHLGNCSKVCQENYGSEGDIKSCNLGCEMGHDIENKNKDPQVTYNTTVGSTESSVNEQQGTIASMIFRPVLLLHSYGYVMMNKLTYYVQSSTSYYFRTNDGGMMVVNIQDQPKVYMETNMQYPSDNDEKPSVVNKKQHTHGELHESWIIVRKGHHWLHCVSYRSGFPMWILTSVLLLSSLVLLWLCCSSSSGSSPVEKPPKKAFLIKDYLSKNKDDEDAPLLDLNHEKQAEPLSSKTAAAIINI